MTRLALVTTLVGLALVGSGCSSTSTVSVCEEGERPVVREVQETGDIRVEYLMTGHPVSSIHDPAIGPDGRIWFADTWRSCLGVVDLATGDVVEYPTLDRDARPHGIDVGVDGTVWYAATATGKLGRFDPADGAHREYRVSEDPVDPHTILVNRGRVWFTAPRANMYGYVDLDSGRLERFDGPYPRSRPYGLAAGPDGSIWMTLGGVNRVGRVSPETGGLTTFELPESSQPHRISVSEDGGVWYTDRMGHRIGRLDPTTGSVQSHRAFSDRAFPLSIATDSRGDVWYYEEGTSKLVRISPRCSSESVITLDLPGVIVRHMISDPATEAVWLSLGEASGVARVSSIDGDTCRG